VRTVRPGRQRIAVAAVVLLGAGAPGVARAHPGLHELSRAASAEVARHPQDPEAHLQRARVHQLAHEWDAAFAELEAAAARGADPVAVGAGRGEVHLGAGRPRMAKVEFDRVLARRPEAHGIRFERGRAWLALGRADRAAKDFGDAIARLPEPRPEHVIARRDALLSLGRKKEALRALEEPGLDRASRRDPGEGRQVRGSPRRVRAGSRAARGPPPWSFIRAA
jgi:predicted Zn-dependent protease